MTDYAELVKHLDDKNGWYWDEDKDALRVKAARAIEALVRENAQLSAGQCIVKDGLLMGDGGHAYCALVRERDAFWDQAEYAIRDAKRQGREAGIRETAAWVQANLCKDATVDAAILALIDKLSQSAHAETASVSPTADGIGAP